MCLYTVVMCLFTDVMCLYTDVMCLYISTFDSQLFSEPVMSTADNITRDVFSPHLF